MSKNCAGALPVRNYQGEEQRDGLEKANEDLRLTQAELQRRWQYLAEAQRLSHSGTFGWKVNSGELDWSDETYSILGFTRETNLTLDLVFDRIHPNDRERLRILKDVATKDGMDLDDEHRLVMPDGAVKHVHVVAHAGFDSAGNREYIGVVTDITERKRAENERQALSRDLPKFSANRVQLQQVLLNLMLNAIEAMKDTGGELTIRARTDEDGRVLVSISDTGTGLLPDSAERIFDPFHTTKAQGTGMGLTITRSIIESYGGRVWASANLGAGATFFFTLPGETEAHA